MHTCILFRNLLVWLDSFDQKWNSLYDRNGLERQFWQMKSALRLRGCLLSDYAHASPVKAQFKYLSYSLFRGRVKIGPVARRNFIYQEKQ